MSKLTPDNRLEILFEGTFYDVTNFIEKHPGGNVIKYYTEKGEDATLAIQQFHNRSIDKILLMLKSFKKRPAPIEEIPLDPKTLAIRREMTQDFAKLHIDIQKEGLFKPSYSRLILRLLECFLLHAVAVLCLFMQPSHLLIKVFGCICFALGSGRAGFLQHEAGHNSFTGNPKLDKIIQSIYIGFFLGLSAGWWNRGHNKHHAMPQRLHRDVDLNTMPFLAYNTKVVEDPKQGKSFFVQNQTWLFLSIDTFLGYWAWRLVICPRNAWKREDFFDILMMLLHTVYSVLLFREAGIGYGVLAYWIGTNYMFGNFALAHTHLPVTDENTHWLEFGLIHTSNIKSNYLVDWWMGYLNYQIEHHLFPTLPQFNSYYIKDRVEALAKKYNLPYTCYSYWESWAITLKNFNDVAKELKLAD